MALRHYANVPATTLAASCSSLDTTIQVASAAGLPISYPFIMILDYGASTEEVVLVTAAAGAVLTVTRGYDSTTAFAHTLGAVAAHGVAAIDMREANTHVNANTGIHGLTGQAVGTTDTQTLTNKTIGSTNIINGFTANKLMRAGASGRLEATDKNIPNGDVVGTTDTQVVTNKTLNAVTNTINGLTANRAIYSDVTGRLSAHSSTMPTGALVGTSDTQTLTNKTYSGGSGSGLTLTSSTLNGFDPSAGWTSYSVTLTADSGNPVSGATTRTGMYRRVGDTVHFYIRVQFTGSGSLGSGGYHVNLPFSVNNTFWTYQGSLVDASASEVHLILGRALGSDLTLYRMPGTAGAGLNLWNSTAPITPAILDIFVINGTFEAA